jgi:hypothetical protein
VNLLTSIHASAAIAAAAVGVYPNLNGVGGASQLKTQVTEEQDRLARQLDLVTVRLGALDSTHEEARTHLQECLALAGDCQTVYACGSDTTRRMANQAFFTRIYLDDDTIRTEPTRSFGLLLDPGTQQQALSCADPQRRPGKRPTQTLIHHVEGSSKTRGVEWSYLVTVRDHLRGRVVVRLPR